jgi:hypothetical protein
LRAGAHGIGDVVYESLAEAWRIWICAEVAAMIQLVGSPP